jgi:probable HAF family extracellular repeat protein
MSLNQLLKTSKCTHLLARSLAVAGLAAVLGTSNAATSYTVTNLSLGGTISYATAVNASGQVAGSAYLPGNSKMHAFRYNGSVIQDLGTLGGEFSSASAINDSGQVTGKASVARNAAGLEFHHAFIYSANAMQDLGTLAGQSSAGYAINASGQVAGESYNSGGNHAFRYNGSVMEDLGTLGGVESQGVAINDNGQVAGTAYSAGNVSSHAFLWTDGTMINLGSLGGNHSSATATNAYGQVTGTSELGGNLGSHAFLYSNDSLKDLGTLGGRNSLGTAINANGQVAGRSQTAGNATFHAFIHDGTSMQDLGILETDPSLNLVYSMAINADGQVVGYARDSASGNQKAFLWSSAEGMIDLNTRLINPPAGLQLFYPVGISDTGFIIADSNVGAVLLSPAQPTTPPTAPALGPISADDPVAIGVPVHTSASFSDINTGDSHTATWAWENNGTSQGVVTESSGTGTVTGARTYTAAGVYTASVTVTDSSSLSATSGRQIVVYDPSAGFVTGGGWIMSPPGAYKADPVSSGRATFGFVSKYLKGATKPTGNTEFQFQAAQLLFQSANYDWLVVSGARAQYKGIGTINGTGNYQFLLTAVDGAISGGGGKDRFRIKIWHFDDVTKADVVDYDNQLDPSTIGTTNEGTVIGGGSIMIHAK